MSDENIIVDVFDAEYDSVDMLDLDIDTKLSEKVENVEVNGVKQFTIETSEAFSALGEPNEQLRHQLLTGRDYYDQHPITAITGLRAELDDIEALDVVYSDEKNQADYYEWEDENILQEYRIGYFVTSCEDISKIRICTQNDDILGITVDSAGFVGGQDNIARDCKYGLVITNGVVHVRCELDVDVGDFVIPNNSGMAQKTGNNYGCKVVAIHNINGLRHAAILLETSARQLCAAGDELKRLDKYIKLVDENTVSAMYAANEANNKIDNLDLDNFKDGINNSIQDYGNKIDSVIQTDEEYKRQIADALATSSEAKAISESAAVSAESLRNEAITKANKALSEVEDIRKNIAQDIVDANVDLSNRLDALEGVAEDLRTTSGELEGQIGDAIDNIELLEEDIKPLAEWSDGENSGIAGFVAKADDISSVLAGIVKWKDGDGDESLAGYVAEATEKNATVQNIAKYTKKNEDGTTTTGAAGLIEQVDANKSALSLIAEGEGGIAGLRAQVEANKSSIETLALHTGSYEEMETWSESEASTEKVYYVKDKQCYYYYQVDYYKDDDGNLQENGEWKSTKEPSKAGLNVSLAGIRQIADGNKAQIDSLAEFEYGNNVNIRPFTNLYYEMTDDVWSENGKDDDTCYYVPNEDKYYYHNGEKWVSTEKLGVVINDIIFIDNSDGTITVNSYEEMETWSEPKGNTEEETKELLKKVYYVADTKFYYYYEGGKWKSIGVPPAEGTSTTQNGYTNFILFEDLDLLSNSYETTAEYEFAGCPNGGSKETYHIALLIKKKDEAESITKIITMKHNDPEVELEDFKAQCRFNINKGDLITAYIRIKGEHAKKGLDFHPILKKYYSGISGLRQQVSANGSSIDLLNQFSFNGASGMAGIMSKVNEHGSLISQFAQWETDTNQAIAGIKNTADTNHANINLLATWKNTSDINGENLFSYNKLVEYRPSNYEHEILKKDIASGVIKITNGSWYLRIPSVGLQPNTQYTISVENIINDLTEEKIQGTGTTSNFINAVQCILGNWKQTVGYLSPEQKTITFTTKSNIDPYDQLSLYMTLSNPPTVNMTITKIKLERGSVATDWSPASEDRIALIEMDVDDAESKIDIVTTGLSDTNTNMAQITQKAGENGASINMLVTGVDKYSVGEYSQSYGLTWEQAKNTLVKGTIYIPTKHTTQDSHDEEFEKTNKEIESNVKEQELFQWAESKKKITKVNEGLCICGIWNYYQDGNTYTSPLTVATTRDAALFYPIQGNADICGIEEVSYCGKTYFCGYYLSTENVDGYEYSLTRPKHLEAINITDAAKELLAYYGVREINTFIPTNYYTWNGEDWESTEQGVSFITGQDVPNATDKIRYWYIDTDDINDVPKGYQPKGLYKYIDVTWDETDKIMGAIYYAQDNDTKIYYYYYYKNNKWNKVSTLSEVKEDMEIMEDVEDIEFVTIKGHWEQVALYYNNPSNRMVSMITQEADRISLAVANARGSVAKIDTRVTNTEAAIESLATWAKEGKTEDDSYYNIASVKQVADDLGASVSQIASTVSGKYEIITDATWSSTGKNTETVYYVEQEKKYYYYKDSEWKDTTIPTEAGLQVNAASIVTAINNQTNTSAATLNADRINLNGVVTANKTFTIDEEGYMRAIGGTIGGWRIEGNYQNIGKVLFIGDSYTTDYQYRPDGGNSKPSLYPIGWPEYCAQQLGLSKEDYHDAGFPSAGFASPNYPNNTFTRLLEIALKEVTTEYGKETTMTYTREDGSKENIPIVGRGWQLSDITHIIIGGGFNDRIDKDDNGKYDTSIQKLKNAMKKFNSIITSKYPNSSSRPKVFLFAMGKAGAKYEYQIIKNQNLKEQTYPTYKYMATDSTNGFGWNYYDIHNSWDGEDGVRFINDGIHPNTQGVERLGILVASFISNTRGKLYSRVNGIDSNNIETISYTSGITVESSSEWGVAMWAGYSGYHNTPYEDYNNEDKWREKTPFYVTNNGYLYTSNIVATGGSVGGWTLINDALYNRVKESETSFYTSGMTAESTYVGSVAFWAGYHGMLYTPIQGYGFAYQEYIELGNTPEKAQEMATTKWKSNTPFYVTHNGYLHAESGDIGGWELTDTMLKSSVSGSKKGIYIASASSNTGYWMGARDADGNYTFSVSTDGVLSASGAYITGTINAKYGSFSDSVTIGGTKITAAKLRDLYDYATGGNGNGTTIQQIGATSGSIKFGKYFSVSDSGAAQMSNDNGGFLTLGGSSTHPYVSAINLGCTESAISFRTGTTQSNAGSEFARIGAVQDSESSKGYSLKITTAGNIYVNSYHGITGQLRIATGYKMVNMGGVTVPQANSYKYIAFYKGFIVGSKDTQYDNFPLLN